MRMRPFLGILLMLSFALSPAVLSPAVAQEKEKIALLLDRSPSPANAIGYAHIPSLNKLMKDAGFTGSASKVVEEVWFIADLNLGDFRPKWEAGYAVLKRPVEAEALAESLGGYVDTVESRKVVHSPQQTYFVPGTEHPERLGILRPTDRTLLAGWLSPNINVQYAPFLSSQANQPESYLSFMMAVDFEERTFAGSAGEAIGEPRVAAIESSPIGRRHPGVDSRVQRDRRPPKSATVHC